MIGEMTQPLECFLVKDFPINIKFQLFAIYYNHKPHILHSCGSSSPLKVSLSRNGPTHLPHFFRTFCASVPFLSCACRNRCARTPHHQPKQQSTEFEKVADCAYENVLCKIILMYFNNLLIVIIYVIARFHSLFFWARLTADLQDCPKKKTSPSSHRTCLGMMKIQQAICKSSSQKDRRIVCNASG